MPKGLGLFKGTGGGGSTDAWLLTGNTGTDPNTNAIGTTDGAGLNIVGGDSSSADVGISIDGKSDSKAGVWIVGDSSSGEGVLIEGFSPAFDSAIHLKNSGGGIRLSGISEGSNKILVSVDNNGNAAWVSPNVVIFNFNEYVSDAAADADVNLQSGALYRLTGGRTIYQKP